MMDRSQLAYWELRSRDWRIGPPLAPSPEDVAWYEAQVADCARTLGSRPLSALLLGVTPAIATMRWPADTALVAIDWAEGMIRNVWPGEGSPMGGTALCADWRELPLKTESIDFVIGDGCYSALGGLADARRLNAEVRRVLRSGGAYCQRCFCRPDEPAPVEKLFEDLLSGRIRDLDLFRWLLAMTVHGESDAGVDLRAVWQVWRERVPYPTNMREGKGWSAQALANFEFWGRHGGRFTFPSREEFGELAEPWFDLLVYDRPTYSMGEHFPRLLMRRRETAKRKVSAGTPAVRRRATPGSPASSAVR